MKTLVKTSLVMIIFLVYRWKKLVSQLLRSWTFDLHNVVLGFLMVPSPLHFHRSFHLTKIFFSNSIDFYQNKFINMTKFVTLFCIYFNSMDFGQRSLILHSIKLRKKPFPFKNVFFVPIWKILFHPFQLLAQSLSLVLCKQCSWCQ